MTDVRRTDVDDDPGAGHGLDSGASDGLDLTPRTGPPAGGRPARPRRAGPWAWIVLALVAVAVGVVVFQGLQSATLFFRNADEAVAELETLGTRTFRLQGLVVSEPTLREGFTEFTIEFNGTEIPVESTAGEPTDEFGLGRPVVLEGRFADGATVDDPRFLAHEILVKHDETYESENGERIDDAGDGRTSAEP